PLDLFELFSRVAGALDPRVLPAFPCLLTLRANAPADGAGHEAATFVRVEPLSLDDNQAPRVRGRLLNDFVGAVSRANALAGADRTEELPRRTGVVGLDAGEAAHGSAAHVSHLVEHRGEGNHPSVPLVGIVRI